jgi:integrase
MEQFQHIRKRGAIDARGNRIEKTPKPVRQRAVELDIVWLKLVLNWGTKNRDREGQFFLRQNPITDFRPKKEKNPRRPVATHDRYEALLKVADQVTMEIRWSGKREKRRSYFRELLVLCHETGRRISPVSQLRFEDLRLEKTKEAPYGGIVWPGDSDKTDTEYVAPLSPAAREAINSILRDRGIGGTYLFPKPTDPNKPIDKDYANALLKRAETLANLPHLQHGGYHAYRRKWGTERKHLPDADVMAAGGWSDPRSLKEAYQHADPQTTLNVVLNRKELREVK